MGDLRYNTPWRRMTAALYERPRDGKIMGAYDIDVTDAMSWMEEQRAKGHHVTPLHIVIGAMGRALGTVPELNCYARWGRVYYRGDVVVSSAVSIKGRELAVVKVARAHQKSVLEIAQEMQQRVEQTRDGNEERTNSSRNLVAQIPWPFRRWVYQFIRWVVFELGVPLPGTGLSLDSFGSVMISNVGSLGIAYAFPALFPAANLSFVVAMGRVTERPTYVNGELVPRKFMPFGASFDHRVVDGAHIGRLQAAFVENLSNPRALAEPVSPSDDASGG